MKPNPKKNPFVRFIINDMKNGRNFYNRCIYDLMKHKASIQEAEDAYQAAVTQIIKNNPQFKPKKGSIESFLYSCIMNKRRDTIRKTMRQREYVFTNLTPANEKRIDNIEANQSTPLEKLILKETIQKIIPILPKLSPSHLQIIYLREIKGMKYEQISAFIGIPM